jgi:CubicO group peptidase (beta-lactamase class C family)
MKLNMKKVLLSLFLLVIAANYLPAQSVQQKMDDLLDSYLKEKKFNGAVLVGHKGQVVYEKGFGYRNEEDKVPSDVNSIFQIGSITKQFTAAVIMQLQEEGKLSVQDKLSKYYPGFANGDKITIEHLLTHTSGIYNYTNDTTLMKSDVTKHYSQSQMVEMFKKYPPDFEPGTKWNYSNSGYSLLGYIIEKVTGKTYEKVVRERILQPLGMFHSGFDFTHVKDAEKAKG